MAIPYLRGVSDHIGRFFQRHPCTACNLVALSMSSLFASLVPGVIHQIRSAINEQEYALAGTQIATLTCSVIGIVTIDIALYVGGQILAQTRHLPPVSAMNPVSAFPLINPLSGAA